jgi:uroporphyrinogen III methyltransferase/synthase
VAAIRSVRENWRSLIQRTQIACIGPITARTAEELGLTPDVVAERFTIDGLIEAIAQHPPKVLTKGELR